jgi:hypothetical protein
VIGGNEADHSPQSTEFKGELNFDFILPISHGIFLSYSVPLFSKSFSMSHKNYISIPNYTV